MPKGVAGRIEAEKRNQNTRGFAAAAERLRKLRGVDAGASAQPMEEHKRLLPSQAAVLPLAGEKYKAMPQGKPVNLDSVAAVSTTYIEYQNKMQLALQALDPLADNKDIADCTRYSRKREAEQEKYFTKLDNLILAYDSYAKYMKALTNYSLYIFNEDNLKFINKTMSVFVGTLGSDQNNDAKELLGKFNKLLEYINKVVFVQKNHLEVIDDQYKNLKDELLRFTSLFGRSKDKVVGPESLLEISAVFNPVPKKDAESSTLREMESRINDLFEFIDKKRVVLADMRSLMHNARIAIMQSRFLMLVRPEKDVLQKYKEYSVNLMLHELELLKILKDLSDQHIYLWPHFNEDLLRPQSRQVQVTIESIIVETRKACKAMKAASPEKFTLSIEIINRCEEINIAVGQGKGSISGHLAILTDYLKDSDLNPLVKFFVISVAINCYTAKHPLKTNFNKSKVDGLWKDIGVQFDLIKDFADNLKQHKSIFEGELFQFLSNFIILPHYLHEVVSATEHAFLHCENLFNVVDKNNLESKNEILRMQIKFLEMQDTILNFAKDKLGKDYATNFYLKTGKEGYFHLWTLKKNQQLMKDGAQNIITEGLPINAILERNELLRLRLEAIPLEFISGQRKPQDSDYTSAMSQCEMDKFLKQCDRDRQKEEQKKHKLKKSVERKTDRDEKVYQSDYESDEESQDEAVVVEPTVDQPKDQLTEGMNKLLSQLNNNFSVDVVRRGIAEFYPLTLTSDITESSFQALYLVGECYGKVAHHNIYHYGGKELKVIIADCKLALNYYRRAEIVLGKLKNLSVEQHNLYSEWLAISISTHEDRANKYETRLSAEHEALSLSREEAMKRLGELWFTNSQRPDWVISDFSVRRQEVGDAIDALKFCRRKCKELKVGVGKKSDWKADPQAYAFEDDILASDSDAEENVVVIPPATNLASDMVDDDRENEDANESQGFTRVVEEKKPSKEEAACTININFVVKALPQQVPPPAPVPTAATNYSSHLSATFTKLVDLTAEIPLPQPAYAVAQNTRYIIPVVPQLPLSASTYASSSSVYTLPPLSTITSSYSQYSSGACSSMLLVTSPYPYSGMCLSPLQMTSSYLQYSSSACSSTPLATATPVIPAMPNVSAQPSAAVDDLLLAQFRRNDGRGGGAMKPYGYSKTVNNNSGDKAVGAQSR
jgi:hypothetical protein